MQTLVLSERRLVARSRHTCWACQEVVDTSAARVRRHLSHNSSPSSVWHIHTLFCDNPPLSPETMARQLLVLATSSRSYLRVRCYSPPPPGLLLLRRRQWVHSRYCLIDTLADLPGLLRSTNKLTDNRSKTHSLIDLPTKNSTGVCSVDNWPKSKWFRFHGN